MKTINPMTVINKETALKEMLQFLSAWTDDEKFTDEKIEKEYPDALKAIQSGNLVFEKNIPTYKLAEPIKSEEGNTVLSEITFKTRVKPSTQASLADGLKVETQTLRYALRILAYITSQPLGIIDKFSKKDYNTVQQIASVFS